jgi:hypothetical protein
MSIQRCNEEGESMGEKGLWKFVKDFTTVALLTQSEGRDRAQWDAKRFEGKAFNAWNTVIMHQSRSD